MGRIGRTAVVALLPVIAGSVLARPSITTAAFVSNAAVGPVSMSATQFVPSTSPTPTATAQAGGVALQWTPVSLPGAGTVDWVVQRTAGTATTTNVCTGTSAPTLTVNLVSCTDSQVQYGVAYSYSVQPVLIRYGTTTWSLPLGPASSPAMLQGLVFASAGAIVSTTVQGKIDVPYPTGTEAGDVLVMVIVNSRNRPPQRLTGWTDLVSRGIGGTGDFHLYVGWRIADSAASTPVGVDAGVTGASLQIYRYDVPVAAPVPQLRAVQTIAGDTATETAQVTPTPDVATTATAMAMSVVAVRGPNDLTLATANGWSKRSASIATPGTESLGWALADRYVTGAVAVPSPTWQQSGTPTRWIFAGTALG